MKKLFILSIILSSLFGNSQCNILQYGDIEHPSEPGSFLLADPEDLNAWTWRNASASPDIFYRNWGNTGWSIDMGVPFPFLVTPSLDCEVWNYDPSNPEANNSFMGLYIYNDLNGALISEVARGPFVSNLPIGEVHVSLKAKIHMMEGDSPPALTYSMPLTMFTGTSELPKSVSSGVLYSQFLTPDSPNYLSNISTFQVPFESGCDWVDIEFSFLNEGSSEVYFYIGIQGPLQSVDNNYQQYVLIDDIVITQAMNFQFSADVFCTDEDIDPSNVFGVDVISAESGGVDINDLQAGVHDLTITFLDDFGCEHVEIIQDVSFVNSTPVNINVTPSESVCPGTEINVSVDNLNNTNWNSPADLIGSSSNSFDYLVGTDDVTFSVSGEDFNGCNVIGEIAVEVFPEIVVNANIVQAPCESGGLGSIYFQVYGGQAPYIYKWVQNGQVILYGEPLENFPPGTYVLAVMDANGCEFVQEYTISVEADFYYLEINNQDEADLLLSYTLLTIADQLVINVTSDQEDFIDINYSHITFGPYGKVVVKEGSKVRFINCTLTACADNWEGVTVEGSSSTSSESGFLVMIDSYVDRARIGIQSFDQNAFNIDESQYECGIIDARNTVFSNCWRALDIQFGKVDYDYQGRFLNCEIIMTENFYDYWTNFQSQCQFYKVRNFHFENTSIINNTWVLGWYERGAAIAGIDARLIIKSSDPDLTRISGFDRGIDLFTLSALYNRSEVTGYKFDRNHKAILLTNTCYHTIAENLFEVGTDMNINGWDGNYINAEGIVMLGGANFNISENVFHGVMETAFGYDQGPIGIRIRDSFTSGDMVYKNTFDGFLVANLANGYNFNAQQENGLRYSCNVNTNNVFDFQVSHELNDLIITPSEDFGIGANQVFQSLELIGQDQAVENSFTNANFSGLAADGQFFNAGMEIDYFSNLQTPIIYTEGTVNVLYDQVNDNNCLYTFNSNLITEGLISTPVVVDQLEQLNDNIFQLDFLIASLVDGGEHNELIQEIDFTVSQNLLQVRDRLISASPFVSMEVFLHLLDKPETFTNLFCLEILMLNPDLLRSDKLFIILTSKESPFAIEQIELLRSLRSSKDMKWELLHERDVQALLKFDIELGLKMKSIDEGTISESDYLSVDMTQAEYSEGMMKLDALLAGKNYTLAQTELAIFKQNMKSPVIRQHLNDYSEWITFCVQLDSFGMDFTSLSEDQMLFLRDHSINSSWSGRIAQKLLEYYYNEDGYSNPFVDYRMFNQTRNYVITEEINADLLYPNPANDLVYLSIIENEVNFQILNSLGQVVMENMYFSGEPIDISALPVGQYIMKMLDTSISPMRFTKL